MEKSDNIRNLLNNSLAIDDRPAAIQEELSRRFNDAMNLSPENSGLYGAGAEYNDKAHLYIGNLTTARHSDGSSVTRRSLRKMNTPIADGVKRMHELYVVETTEGNTGRHVYMKPIRIKDYRFTVGDEPQADYSEDESSSSGSTDNEEHGDLVGYSAMQY